MKCPVCKYDNQQGATHCGMCYEVFNRSAAQNYNHAVQRDRRDDGEMPDPPSVAPLPEKRVKPMQTVIAEIDWAGLREVAISLLRRSKYILLMIGALLVLWLFAGTLLNPNLWYHTFGKKLRYAFPDKNSNQYMVGLKQNMKFWSEREGRLDTPMSESKSDEIANVLLAGKKGPEPKQFTVFVKAIEWIQITNDASGSSSHALAATHPSLAGARLVFDGKGRLLERHVVPSPRLGKSVPFLVPKFPPTSLRRGQVWDEPVEWMDVYGDWKLQWAGILHWKVGELEACQDSDCLKLTCTADVAPHLAGWPSWADGAVQHVSATMFTQGEMLFDGGHNRLLSNTFSYKGFLRIPIADLGRIPFELRVGRRVRGKPGEIVVHLENKIELRKN